MIQLIVFVVLSLALLPALFARDGFHENHKIFEKSRLEMREDVTMLGKANRAVQHELVFAISPKNMDKLEIALYEVSSTRSSMYGQFWSRQKIEDLTHNVDGHNLVLQFLNDNGVTVHKKSKYGNYIYARAAIHEWESILKTEFHNFKVSHLRDPVTRCLSFSLPHEISSHIQGVFNTVQFPFNSGGKKARKMVGGSGVVGGNNAGYVTPPLINQYYNVTNNTASFLVSQAVYESIGQQMSPSDLTYFQTYFDLPIQPISRNIGGNADNTQCDSDTCGEANLDIQYMMGIAHHANTTYYYDNDWMFGWILSVGDSDYPSDVYSISYGAPETGLEASYTSSFNNEAIKLGTMGVTILAASGDSGVAGSYGNDGTKYCGYSPQFPASSPYITTVGATMGPQSNQPEVGCQAAAGTTVLITSGGGFSTHFVQPSWQKQAITNYFATVDGTSQQPYQGTTAIEYNNLNYEYFDYIKIPTYFNATGRGYPDVALLGHSYMVAIGGAFEIFDGTSASTPVMAAFVTLANHQRVLAKASKMGFLNPFLYENANSFVHDITSGNNKCTEAYGCTSSSCKVHCCSEGFYATHGWDPMTGLGSVSYRNFVQTALNVIGVSEPTLRPSNAPHSASPSTSVPTEPPTTRSAVPTHVPTIVTSHAPSTHTTPSPTLAPFAIPPITLPPVSIPPFTIPPVSIPPFTFPPVSVPPFTIPPVSIPPFTFPPVSVPPFTIPPVSIPPFTFPPLSLPTVAPVISSPTQSPVASIHPSAAPTLVPSTATLGPSISMKPTTHTPSAAPSTQSPTSDYEGISFTVFQTITGITQSMYQTEMTGNNYVIAETSSFFVPGTSTSTITINSVVNNPTAAASRFKAAATSSILVTYTVSIDNIYAANYASANAAYVASTTDLVLAASSGKYTTKLNTNAVNQGSSNLNAVVVNADPLFSNYTISYSTSGTNSAPSSGQPASAVSAGGVAAIVIVLLAVFAACGGFYYYYYMREKSADTSPTAVTKATAFHFDSENTRNSEMTSVRKDAPSASAEVELEGGMTVNPILQKTASAPPV